MTLEHWIEITDEIGAVLAAGVEARDATDTFVAEAYPMLRERGLVAMMVPTELGGGGASHSTVCRVLARLATHDASAALALAMHQHLVAAQVFQHRAGNPRAAKTLDRVAKGAVLVSTGARDWLESNGRMERVEGGYRLTASKAFASGSPAGDVAVTSAPYEDPVEGWRVLHFPVPMRADGVRVGDDWVTHGMRGTGSHTLHFESVFVPDEAIVLSRPRGPYHPVWSVVIAVALPLIASVYVGVAERAAEVARPFARRRSADPAVAWAVGAMDTERIHAGALLDAMIATTADLSFTPSIELSNRMLALKTATVTAARTSVERAFDAAGGPAFYRRTGLDRLLRDARAGDAHLLSPDAQRLFTGRLGLGLDPTG